MSRNPYLDSYRKTTCRIGNLFRDYHNIEHLVGQFSLIYSTMGCVLSDLQSIISCCTLPPKEHIEIREERTPPSLEVLPVPKARRSDPVTVVDYEQISRQFNENSKRTKPTATHSERNEPAKPVPESIGFSGMIDCEPSEIVRKKGAQNSRKSTNLSEYIQKNREQPAVEQNFFDALQRKKPLYQI